MESKALRNAAERVIVVLDPGGNNSPQKNLHSGSRNRTKDIDFIVGGPAGLDIEDANLKLESFGNWTIPHELSVLCF